MKEEARLQTAIIRFLRADGRFVNKTQSGPGTLKRRVESLEKEMRA